MPLKSVGECPWCGAEIDLRTQAGVCACPVCSCTFKRNSGKWKIGIPVAILVAVLVWIFVPFHGHLAACLGASAVLIFTAKTTYHKILSGGRTDLTTGEANRHRGKSKESKWFIIAVALLLAAVLVLLLLAFGQTAKHG